MSLDEAAIAKHWPLTGARIGPAFGGYPDRQVVRVSCDQGEFVAKVDKTRWRSSATARLVVLELLASRGYRHAPSLLPTIDGESFVDTGDATIWLLERVPLPLADDGVVSDDTWHALGRAAGELNAHRDCPVGYAIPTRDAVAELAERVRGEAFEKEYLALLARVEGLDEGGPVGLIHGEINEANAARRADGSVVLLDWDQAGTGPTLVEYGYPLILQFVSKHDLTFRASAASAFYGGYLETGATIDASRLFSSGLFHALRYLWPPSMDAGEIELRWRRVRHSVRHRHELCAVLP